MNILTIVTSASKESVNRKLYLYLKKSYNFQDSLFSVELLPFFSKEIEKEQTAIILNWQKKILQADKILWISPEYNHSWPAVGKNAFDWASRKNLIQETSPLYNKQIYLLGASSSQNATSFSQNYAEEMFAQTHSQIKDKLGLQIRNNNFESYKQELDWFMKNLLD